MTILISEIITLICIGVIIWLISLNTKKTVKEYEKKILEKEKVSFSPYLARTARESKIFDKNKIETGEFLPKNAIYTVVFEEDNLCELLSGDWVEKENLLTNFSRIQQEIPAKVKENSTVLRNGPSYGFHVCQILPKNTTVKIVDNFGNWSKVITSDGTQGYVLKSTLTKY